MNLVAGLDLAAVRDFSALAVVERVEVATADIRRVPVHYEWGEGWDEYMVPEQHYLVRHLHRWHRGTDPAQVIDDVADLFDEQVMRDCMLRFDATGMGVGVRSIVQERHQAGRFGHRPVGVTIHGGDSSTSSSVAKIDLVSSVTRLLRERRLHLPEVPKNPEDDDPGMQLRRELLGFQVKVTASGRETFGAQTESLHDDMVIAVALAVWGKPVWHAAPRRWSPEELAEALGQARAAAV